MVWFYPQNWTITWWRHHMETFFALLVFCLGIFRSPVNSPHKGQWRGALMFSVICAWIRYSKESWGWRLKTPSSQLWRHSNAEIYDEVTYPVMCWNCIQGDAFELRLVLCFVVVMQSFIMNSHEVFIHIHQGCFAGTGAIDRLPQCQWRKPDRYGKISQCITTTKHSKAKTVCIFLGIYCIVQL